MKRKDLVNKLNGMSQDELKTALRTNAEEQMKLRFRHASRQLEKTSQIGILRREFARMKTILTQKASA